MSFAIKSQIYEKLRKNDFKVCKWGRQEKEPQTQILFASNIKALKTHRNDISNFSNHDRVWQICTDEDPTSSKITQQTLFYSKKNVQIKIG